MSTISDANAAIKRLQGEVDRLTRERDEAVARWNATAGASQRDLDAALVEQHRYSLALAAAQADNRALREALRAAHDATEAAQEGTDIEGQGDESVMAAYEEGTRAVLRVTTPALSRAPGGTEALREVCERVADVVRARFVDDEDGPQYGIRTRLEIEEAWRMNRAAIVSRILGPEGGKA